MCSPGLSWTSDSSPQELGTGGLGHQTPLPKNGAATDALCLCLSRLQ